MFVIINYVQYVERVYQGRVMNPEAGRNAQIEMGSLENVSG